MKNTEIRLSICLETFIQLKKTYHLHFLLRLCYHILIFPHIHSWIVSFSFSPSCLSIMVGCHCFQGGEMDQCDWPPIVTTPIHPHIIYDNGFLPIPSHCYSTVGYGLSIAPLLTKIKASKSRQEDVQHKQHGWIQAQTLKRKGKKYICLQMTRMLGQVGLDLRINFIAY